MPVTASPGKQLANSDAHRRHINACVSAGAKGHGFASQDARSAGGADIQAAFCLEIA